MRILTFTANIPTQAFDNENYREAIRKSAAAGLGRTALNSNLIEFKYIKADNDFEPSHIAADLLVNEKDILADINALAEEKAQTLFSNYKEKLRKDIFNWGSAYQYKEIPKDRLYQLL